jgi:uncharacterized membrane protein
MVWNDPNYQIVSGTLNSESKVGKLLDDLESQGINRDLINVVMSDKTRDQYSELAKENKMPEGASVGGLSGGLLGGLIGGLTMAGTLLIPGVNLLVAGPIVGAIAGGAIGAASGSLVGALVGLGIPEYEAKAYEKDLKEQGNVLVIAHVLPSDAAQIKSLFEKHGSVNTVIKTDIAPAGIVS